MSRELPRALQGEVVVVRQVVDLSARVQAITGPGPLERLHERLSPSELVELTRKLSDFFRATAREVLLGVVPGLGWPGVFYFERQPNVRIHVPYAHWLQGRKVYQQHARVVGEGKLSVHAPHRDSDHGCPLNAVNLWVALGRVRPGNGLCLYPRAFGQERLDFDQPQTFALEPGDAVVFAGEHLHTSELNCTEESRVVVSYRLTLGRPRYRGRSLHDYLPSYPSPTRWLRDRLIRAHTLLFKRPVKHPFPSLPHPRSSDPGGPGIWAISEQQCRVRLASGRCATMARRCPHQGTDLAAVGRVEGERVVCPWHNLALDPEAEC